ncbi:MAG TPA: cytochrome c oxidase assembly protein [Actinomycetales bacterium]|nr:cytochrome c oxidase assembly protein [Actinomycetales bacterium]
MPDNAVTSTVPTSGDRRVVRPAPGTSAGGARVLAALAVPAVVACCAALLLTSGAAGTAIDDPGGLTRWGLPLVRVVRDLAAALTVGLLVVAVTVLPADGGTSTGRHGHERPQALGGVTARAGRLASAAGAVWVVSGALVLLLTYSRISGVAVTDPRFAGGLSAFLTSIQVLRSLLISTLVAAAVTTGVAVATRHTTLALMSVLALVALLPVALTGHAAGTASHEVAVDSLAAHLVGVTVWVGGLAALVLLRRGLATGLPVAAARYSRLALAAFVLVAASGVVNAWVRLGGWSGLATSYGAVVVAKAFALVLLGAAGAWHRRSMLRRLAAQPAAVRSFWRLVGAELAVMGAAVGLAVALSSSAPPVPETQPGGGPDLALTGYPMPAAPTATTWLTGWRFDLFWTSVAAALLVGYLLGVRRLAVRGDRWPVGRILCWTAGCLVLVYATSGAPGIYGRVLFSAHMLGHMTMSMVAPPLLVLGAPVTLALRALHRRADGSRGAREWLLEVVHSRLLRVLGNPLVAAGLFAGSLIVFYYSPLFELSLRTHTGHLLMHLHFLLTGYLFASVLIGVDPGVRHPPYPLRLVLLFATMAFHAFFGLALLSGSQLLAPEVLTELGRTWGRSPLADQQLGGAWAWGLGELPTVLLGLGVAIAWARSDDRESRRSDRQADRDGDAELAAYNAHLARLSERDGG